ncbi:hypothetical protein MTR_7g451490 [Medicago truncatula]|uniref:RNase H type-1 domain-containing protein n=1 Tax=Medicago truncatula TaxID=3880 RepID=A0A072TYC2_MEDTR|nr:hypothetical protein MTR_7g451490 [Medicago truncatula]
MSFPLLDSFSVSSHRRQIREVLSVKWKAPSAPWLKVNTNGYVIGINDACGSLFRDHLDSFLGAFTCNLGTCSVFTAEVHAFILALEYAALHGWRNLWFKNPSLIPVLLRNHLKMLAVLVFRLSLF